MPAMGLVVPFGRSGFLTARNHLADGLAESRDQYVAARKRRSPNTPSYMNARSLTAANAVEPLIANCGSMLPNPSGSTLTAVTRWPGEPRVRRGVRAVTAA